MGAATLYHVLISVETRQWVDAYGVTECEAMENASDLHPGSTALMARLPAEKCPECDSELVMAHSGGRDFLSCLNRDCGWTPIG